MSHQVRFCCSPKAPDAMKASIKKGVDGIKGSLRSHSPRSRFPLPCPSVGLTRSFQSLTAPNYRPHQPGRTLRSRLSFRGLLLFSPLLISLRGGGANSVCIAGRFARGGLLGDLPKPPSIVAVVVEGGLTGLMKSWPLLWYC